MSYEQIYQRKEASARFAAGGARGEQFQLLPTRRAKQLFGMRQQRRGTWTRNAIAKMKEFKMPGKKNASLKKPEMYEDLREDGASKEKAARISNAAAQKGRSASSVGRKGGEAGSYEDWTVAKLRERAKELGMSNYSSKKKAELVKALRNH